MDIEQGLRMFIEQGTPEAGKGYPLVVPQTAAFPSFAYQTISNNKTIAHSGRVVLRRAVIQISVVGADYPQAKQVQDILEDKLDGFKGMMGGVDVQFCKTVVSDDWADVHQLPVVKFDVTIVFKPKGA